jgi:hypothetical protein
MLALSGFYDYVHHDVYSHIDLHVQYIQSTDSLSRDSDSKGPVTGYYTLEKHTA